MDQSGIRELYLVMTGRKMVLANPNQLLWTLLMGVYLLPIKFYSFLKMNSSNSFPVYSRKLYWADLGSANIPPKIGRVDMDGRNPVIIIKDDVVQPQCVVVDLNTKNIFWSSSRSGKVSIPFSTFLCVCGVQ